MASRTRALGHFKKADPLFHKATKHLHKGLPETLSGKRTRAELFSSLVRIVTSQQLGTGAARSIYARIKESCGGVLTPEIILATPLPALRKTGLSGAKIKTIRAIASAVQSGELELLSLKRIPEEEAAKKLTSIWGLGPWSVEMFLMNTLGRADVFSAGDLGLVRAMEAIYGLPKNAPRETLVAIARKWSPYRTYACLLLWRSRD